MGEMSSFGIGDQLSKMGCSVSRMKTGTPPRVDARSLNLSELFVQPGDESPDKFSFLNIPSAIQNGHKQKDCYIVHTNNIVHEILRSGFDQSPLFTGLIHGIGPRYCPSIEDKLRTFANKDSHPLFLEPQGWNTCEYYLQGFSSSLPLDIQYRALREIKGFKNIKIFRPAYAVEYDYFDPTQLKNNLESRIIPNLFLAGQVNGTTGYEEAAAQGLMAGINAHLKLSGKEPFILKRDQAYIGVLIDDLITKGVDEPYRMFTSRAEYRILLRQDNADFRLTEIGYKLGLVDEFRFKTMINKYSIVNSLINSINSTIVEKDVINPYLSSIDQSPINENKKLVDILTRPNISLSSIINFVPRGTFDSFINDSKLKIDNEFSDESSFLHQPSNSDDSYSLSSRTPWSERSEAHPDSFINYLYNEMIEDAEIAVKYKGYIDRERRLADKILRLENLIIPEDFDFSRVSSLSMECRIKLNRYKPRSIAQASRISGVSPADISVLLIYFGR